MNGYLTTVEDSVVMTPEVFINLMKRFHHHRRVQYGFSKKHTADIEEYRKRQGVKKNESTIPSNLYQLPVQWNTDITYVRSAFGQS